MPHDPERREHHQRHGDVNAKREHHFAVAHIRVHARHVPDLAHVRDVQRWRRRRRRRRRCDRRRRRRRRRVVLHPRPRSLARRRVRVSRRRASQLKKVNQPTDESTFRWCPRGRHIAARDVRRGDGWDDDRVRGRRRRGRGRQRRRRRRVRPAPRAARIAPQLGPEQPSVRVHVCVFDAAVFGAAAAAVEAFLGIEARRRTRAVGFRTRDAGFGHGYGTRRTRGARLGGAARAGVERRVPRGTRKDA